MSTNEKYVTNLFKRLESYSTEDLIAACKESGMPDDFLFNVQVDTNTIQELKQKLFTSLIISYGIAKNIVTGEELYRDPINSLAACAKDFIAYYNKKEKVNILKLHIKISNALEAVLNSKLENIELDKLVNWCINFGMPIDALFNLQAQNLNNEVIKLELLKSLLVSYGLSTGIVTYKVLNQVESEEEYDAYMLTCMEAFFDYIKDELRVN